MLREIKASVIFNYLKGKHSTGQIVNLLRYLSGKPKPVVSWDPVYLVMSTSYGCNLSCDMCLTHSQRHANLYGQKPCQDMDFATYQQVLNRYHKALVVDLTGCGEPLLNKDFFRMVEYASATMRMYVAAATNGILIRKYTQQLANSSLSRLIISINSYSPGDYFRLTGMPDTNFALIKNNTRDLVELKGSAGKRKIKIWLSFILDNKNYLHLEEMIDLARELAVDTALFLPFLPSPQDGFWAEERCLFSNDSEVLARFRQAKARNRRSKTKIILPPLLDKKMLKEPDKFRYCKVPFYVLTVDGEGNLGGCSCQLLDNSKNGKFYDRDAWNNEYFQQLRSRFLNSRSPLLSPCGWCYNNLP